MDIALIATAAMSILGPYLAKAAESIATKAGEDLWSKIKNVFKKDNDKELLIKADNVGLSKPDLVEFEESLVEYLKADSDFLQEVKEKLNITANEIILENKLSVAAEIREELKPLYRAYKNAGIGTEGDYENKIDQQERKLKKIDDDIIAIIINK